MEMVSSIPVAASNDDFHDEPLLKKLCVLLCMPQNAPQNTTISWGSMPPDPPRVNNCREAMFTTSPNDIAAPPPDGESYVWPWTLELNFHYTRSLATTLSFSGWK